jgi:myo-inositol-1(or 4)-monophosphatase
MQAGQDPEALAAALATAVRIAEEAGQILLEGWDRRPAVSLKAHEQEVVTEFDRRSEEHVVTRLQAAFPDDAVVGEEGTTLRAGAARTWYVDPLDGTINFAHGLPLFGVSIGLVRAEEPILGVVHAPALGWIFSGARGVGSVRNGVPIAPSPVSRLERALLATGFPTAPTSRQINLPEFSVFTAAAEATRRLGSAALDLCFVACGWLDGYWERLIKPWDTAGGAAVALAAGARVTDLDGSPFRVGSGRVLASNGLLHEQIVRLLGGPQGSFSRSP